MVLEFNFWITQIGPYLEFYVNSKAIKLKAIEYLTKKTQNLLIDISLITIGNVTVSWKSLKQDCVVRSTMKYKLIGLNLIGGTQFIF